MDYNVCLSFRKCILILIALFISYNCAFAQGTWCRGVVIKTTEDSIKGEIQMNSSKINSQYCNFRDSNAPTYKTFTPDLINGYSYVNGKKFVSREILLDSIKKRVFLEYLVEGLLSIYHYKDEVDRYFAEKGSDIYELKNTSVERIENEIKYSKNRKEYIGILSLLTHETSLQTEISNSPFTVESFISIAKKYNKIICNEKECVIYEVKMPSIIMKKSVLAGLIYNSFDFGHSLVADYNMGFKLGGQVEFFNLINWFDNLSLSTGITVNKYSSYLYHAKQDKLTLIYNGQIYNLSNFVDPSNSGILNSKNIEMKLYSLKIPLVINYVSSSARIKPYFGIGEISTIYISQNKDFVYTYDFTAVKNTVPAIQVGLLGKIGMKFPLRKNTFYTEMNFETAMSLVSNPMIFYNREFCWNLGFEF